MRRSRKGAGDTIPGERRTDCATEHLQLTGQAKNEKIMQMINNLCIHGLEAGGREFVAKASEILGQNEMEMYEDLVKWAKGRREIPDEFEFGRLIGDLAWALDTKDMSLHDAVRIYLECFEQLKSVPFQRKGQPLYELITQVTFLSGLNETDLEMLASMLLDYERIIQKERKVMGARKTNVQIMPSESMVEDELLVMNDEESVRGFAKMVFTRLTRDNPDAIEFGNCSLLDHIRNIRLEDPVLELISLMITRSQTGEGEQRERAVQWVNEMLEINSDIITHFFSSGVRAQETQSDPTQRN
ncbi:MAG: hypothetical protein ABII22_00200 [Candidatus Micrarchaeota archaeon]